MGVALLEGLLDEPSLDMAATSEPEWLTEARRAAAAGIARDGMPAPRSEAWKYTSLRALERRRFVGGDADAAQREVDEALLELPGVAGPRMVFVNGAFRVDLSRLPEIAGLSLQSLSSVLRDAPDSLQAILGNRIDDASQVFARLNAALAIDGPVVRIAEGAQIDQPIHLVFFGAETPDDIAWHVRAVVSVGAGAGAEVVEHHVGAANVAHLGNLVADYHLHPGAHLALTQVQNAPETAFLVRRSDVVIESDAQLQMHSLELGASLMRHDLAVQLAVADQRSRGVFHGGITILAGADGSDAQLTNKNLLLSAQAEIDTQPVLEIYADEVKAAHGATVGQLDESALFYLRSRGIAADAARRLLTLAFCRVAIDSVANDPLREHLDALLLDHLPDAEA